MLRALPGRVLRKAEYTLKTSRFFNAAAESEKKREAGVVGGNVGCRRPFAQALAWRSSALRMLDDRGVSRASGSPGSLTSDVRDGSPSCRNHRLHHPDVFRLCGLLGDDDPGAGRGDG
jgi:hypothetical protein